MLERVNTELQRLLQRPIEPGLHIVATPIGNLGDITLRALATLARVDAIWCEDTRHTRTLLQHFAIDRPLRPYHEHNAAKERPGILAALAAGRALALVSDAGTPLVSDPGYKLVRDAIEAGHTVTALPGPSAVLAALTVAGLPTDRFLFAGFLPPREAARRTRLAELARVDTTLVVFETGPRLAETLADAADILGDRPAAVARELTKFHEEVARGTLRSLAASPPKPLGEIVLVIGPPLTADVSDDDIRKALAEIGPESSVRDAAREVAERLDVQKARVYSLAIKKGT